MNIFMSVVGVFTLLSIAYLMSENRKAINMRTVIGAFAIQAGLAFLTLYSPLGSGLMLGMANAVSSIVKYSDAGISFLFGGLASPKMYELFGGGGFVMAIKVLPIIVFFSTLTAILYYLGIMQKVVQIIGGALQKALGTSKAESLSATGNVFLGATEAPLLIKPYLLKMSRSELFAVYCGGLASIAGTMLASYAQLGVKMEYLLAASFMAAPGGLLFAKILIPESKKEETQTTINVEEEEPKSAHANLIDAAASGASDGVSLAINVGAMLLAFVSLVALLNGLIGGVGGWFGLDSLSLELIFGWMFSPLAFLIGVPWEEATVVGSFIGQKVVINEFFAYINLVPYLNGEVLIEATGMPMTERTQAIVSFALCGFANFGTVAIIIAGLGGLVPSRRHELSSLSMKALAAGVLSNLMGATLAGLFFAL